MALSVISSSFEFLHFENVSLSLSFYFFLYFLHYANENKVLTSFCSLTLQHP